MPPDIPRPETIRAALERIVTSPQLESSPSLCRFLGMWWRRRWPGRGGRSRSTPWAPRSSAAATISTRDIDPIVRVQARNLRARMAKYYEGPGAQETVLIDLPKRTYVPVFAVREAATARLRP